MGAEARQGAPPGSGERDPCYRRLRGIVDDVARLLPMQGPIAVFIHHNPLHAFEHLPFERAVIDAWELFGAEPYMSEADYRAALAAGRIGVDDIDAILDTEPDAAVLPRLSRRSLRRAMMASPGVREFDAATILWRAEQGDLARDFRQSALRSLFITCLARSTAPEEEPAARNQVERTVHTWLIRLGSVFLDQGLAYWPMPHRERGFYVSVRSLLSLRGAIFPRYLAGLDKEFRRQQECGFAAADAVLDCLEATVPEADWPDAIRDELLALSGWAGLMRRLEREPNLAAHQPVPCSLMDWLAVRMTMTHVAARQGAAESVPQEAALKTREKRRLSRAARIYDAARVLSLSADEVSRLADSEWAAFVDEVRACNGLKRRRIFQLAYERHHERAILRGLESHRAFRSPAGRDLAPAPTRPAAQFLHCIDEREESMRRALEETDSCVETFSAAGHFGIAVDYKGIDDARAAALSPAIMKPRHAVYERPQAGEGQAFRRRLRRRRMLGRLGQQWLLSSKTLVRGWLSTGVLGLFSAVPLIAHLLAPRRYAELRERLNKAFLPEPRTELTLMRSTAQSHDAVAGLLTGFAPVEKIERVAGVLGPAGLRRGFARVVVVLGHGSTSLNNPHESAHDCGACGGRRGGPNARLFAAMANRPEVRAGLRGRGIEIPDDTWFLGGYHDTCSDDVELFDLEAVPGSHQPDLARVRALIDAARAGNAHERTRRFDSCPPRASAAEALLHVEERSEHLAEPRPEYGHCTNAVCIVGGRRLTRGLFLDRRAFLASYDDAHDVDDRDLATVLAAVVPVCAGIGLEYYFSFVDNHRYGCGTKLPHNVTALVGVMDGHASDLRTGLPWQMVEIHEPVRTLFVVETTPQRLLRVVHAQAGLSELVKNRWIRLAAIDPVSGRVHVWRESGFEELVAPIERLPVAETSAEWYAGKTQHLPIAWIRAGAGGR